MSPPASRKGVKTKAIAGAGLGYTGWFLGVNGADSKIKDVSGELDGKKVGITSAGSASGYYRALDPRREEGESSRPVLSAAAGWCLTSLSGNVDAIVLHPPLSF